MLNQFFNDVLPTLTTVLSTGLNTTNTPEYINQIAAQAALRIESSTASAVLAFPAAVAAASAPVPAPAAVR